jgi:hypothetical protein
MSRFAAASAAAATVLLTTSCDGAGSDDRITAAPEALAPFTTALRDAQPSDAFVAVYAVGDRHLIFQGAVHTLRSDSLTFRLINDAYDHFEIDAVIVEGCAYDWGPDPARLVDWAMDETEVDGFVEGGETVPAVRGAQSVRATTWCGEADDAEIRRRVLAAGYSDADLLGFYTLRMIPQWSRERRITGPDDAAVPAMIEAELAYNRSTLELEDAVLDGFEAWAAWYEATNAKPFGAAFELQEVGPLADGIYGSNAVAVAISRARAGFLQDRIADHLNAGESLMVVHGASHLMIHRPALDVMLGEPCYVGDQMEAAARACS